MMHGRGKSDFAILAVKPANKAEHPAEQSAVEATAAEPVERRAETKGNAGQQSTCRTQSRVSVSQALERIRQVAREKKKERFTALFRRRKGRRSNWPTKDSLTSSCACGLRLEARSGSDQRTSANRSS
jgi:hypothetical protein